MSKWRKLGLAAALTASLGMIGASVLTSAEDTTSAAEEFPVTEEGAAEDANDVIEKLGGVLPDDEVDTIQEVFVNTLASYYHSRIEYPNQKDPDQADNEKADDAAKQESKPEKKNEKNEKNEPKES